jgi:hypothetical protein
MQKYKMVEGRDFLFGEGGDVPKITKNGKYLMLVRRIREGQWIQLKNEKDAKGVQECMSRCGFFTRKRMVEGGFYRVWALPKNEEDKRHAVQKRSTKEKVLPTRKRRKDQPTDPETLGGLNGEHEAPEESGEENQQVQEQVDEQESQDII